MKLPSHRAGLPGKVISFYIVPLKNSGIDSIKMHLERIRVKATDDQVNELVLRVKAASLKKKGLVEPEEFRKLVKAVVKR